MKINKEYINNVVGEGWASLVGSQFEQKYMQDLALFLLEERERHTVYPRREDTFNAYKLTQPKNLKVVIVGQDPYYANKYEAHGLAFSVTSECPKLPPSLRNILQEVENSVYDGMNLHLPTDLTRWSKQGVFLLNTVLTVRAGTAQSHSNQGWEKFTEFTLRRINELGKPVVFMLWGAHARKFKQYLDDSYHLVLEAAHPSPLAGGRFFGCNHFKKCNEFLQKNKIGEIEW